MDCDDNDPATYPGAMERCDGVDNNCDRMADDVEDFTSRCNALVDAAFPETMNTSPAFCDQVPAAGRPAGAERFSLVCRRRVVVAATVRCVCVAANGARWQCGCN